MIALAVDVLSSSSFRCSELSDHHQLEMLWISSNIQEGKWKLILEFIINPLTFKCPWFKSLFYFILMINNSFFPLNT